MTTNNNQVDYDYEKIEEKLLTPLTVGYSPSVMYGTLLGQDGMPLINLRRDIPMMLLHPIVKKALNYYKSGIAGAEFEAFCPVERIGRWVLKQTNRFWDRGIPKLQRGYDYGWVGAENLFILNEQDILEWNDLIGFAPGDCFLLTQGSIPLGVRVKNVKNHGKIDLWFACGSIPAKGLWYIHDPQDGSYYGQSQMIAAHRPWRRLAWKDGAEMVIDGGVYRFAYAGPVVRYPEEDFQSQTGIPATTNDSQSRPRRYARDVARQIAEQAKAGAGVGLPSTPYTKDQGGGQKWEIKWPETTLNVEPLVAYAKWLQDQIYHGIGVPPELLQAAETGSGYSGRRIPLESFLDEQQRIGNALLSLFVEQVLKPLVRWNFGDIPFEIRLKRFLETKTKSQFAFQENEQKLLQQKMGQQKAPTSAMNPAKLEQEMKGGPGGQGPSQPNKQMAFGMDIFSSEAQDVFDKAMKAANKLSKKAKKKLLKAFELDDPIEMARSVVAWIEEYRRELIELLTGTQLASLLEGAKDVAKELPVIPEGIPPGPATLEPQAAKDLLDELHHMSEFEQAAKIYDLPPEQQGWALVALRFHETEPLELDVSSLAEDLPKEYRFPIIEEAAKELARKNVVTREIFDVMDESARAKAFTIAGVETNDLLVKIRDVMAENISTAPDYQEFRKRMIAEVESDTFLSEGHMETVFRTNVQSAFSDGQKKVLEHPFVRSGFPYVLYEPIHDDRVRDEHLALEKLGIQGTNLYRIDDPVFQTFRPPWDYNCRCSWIPITVTMAAERGIAEAQRWLETGQEPLPKAFVSMPPFTPPPEFKRLLAGAPLSIQLSTVESQQFVRYLTPKQIQSIREALGMGYWEFAKLFHVSWQCVQKWEHGITHPRLPKVVKLNKLMRLIKEKSASKKFSQEWTQEDERKHPRDKSGEWTRGQGGQGAPAQAQQSVQQPQQSSQQSQSEAQPKVQIKQATIAERRQKPAWAYDKDTGEAFALTIPDPANKNGFKLVLKNERDFTKAATEIIAQEGIDEEKIYQLRDLFEEAMEERYGSDIFQRGQEYNENMYAGMEDVADQFRGALEEYAEDEDEQVLKFRLDLILSEIEEIRSRMMDGFDDIIRLDEQEAEEQISEMEKQAEILNGNTYEDDFEGAASDAEIFNREAKENDNSYRVYFNDDNERWEVLHEDDLNDYLRERAEE